MRPIAARDALRTIIRLCDCQGIDVIIDPSRGKGSHFYVIFVDRATGEKASITIPDKREISPGVQRNSITAIAAFAAGSMVRAVVKAILEDVFGK